MSDDIILICIHDVYVYTYIHINAYARTVSFVGFDVHIVQAESMKSLLQIIENERLDN